MWGGKDSLRAAVWEVLKTEPKGLAAEDISRRVADGGYKLAGGSGTSEVPPGHLARLTSLVQRIAHLVLCRPCAVITLQDRMACVIAASWHRMANLRLQPSAALLPERC